MSILDADVKRIFKNTRAEFVGEVLILGQWAVCRNTDLADVGWELVMRDPDDGTYQFRELEADISISLDKKINAVKGYLFPDDVSFTVNNATREVSVTQTGGTVYISSDGNDYAFANGSPQLSVVLTDEPNVFYCYHDSSGQLSFENTLVKDTIKNYGIASVVRSSKKVTTANPTGDWTEISVVDRWEDKNSNPVENYASTFTKSVIWNPTGLVSLTGTLGGTTVGHSSGDAFTSRDHEFPINAGVVPGKIWSIFYLEDVYPTSSIDKVERHIKTDVPYIIADDIGIAGGTQLVYNSFNGTTQKYETSLVAVNDFVVVLFAIADNPLVQVTTIMPQQTFNTLGNAQSGIDDARASLFLTGDVFRDVGIFGAAVFNGVGQLQYADTNAQELFKYFYQGVESGVSAPATSGLGQTLIKSPDGLNKPINNVSTVQISGDTLNIATPKTPASATATGTRGDVVTDSGYIYVCTATDTWKRAAITTW